jgi:VWFA-related protein
MRLSGLPVAIVLMLGTARSTTAQLPIFRSAADAVQFDVFVSDGGRAVKDLAAEDFELRDDGVPQRIGSLSVESIPTVFTILVDASRSLDRIDIKSRDGISKAAREFKATLGPAETLRGVRIASSLQELQGIDALGSVRASDLGNHTLLFDGILAMAMYRVDPFRRHVMIVITDGLDTMSTIDPILRRDVLRRIDAATYVLTVAASRHHSRFAGFGGGADVDEAHLKPLREIAQLTGGEYLDVKPGQDFTRMLTAVRDEFRSRYVLTYVPSNRNSGWHALKVTVSGKKLNVRHRPGYWRPSGNEGLRH